MSSVLAVSWEELKNFIIDKNISLQYISTHNGYYVNAIEGSFVVQSFIPITDPKNLEQIDFEENYKTKGNKPLQTKNPTDGAIQVALSETEGNAYTLITHDWADNTTWVNGVGDSTWLLEPPAGKIYYLKKAEVQFSHDVQLNGITSLRFDTWVYNPLYDPNQTTDSDDPSFQPGDAGNPLRFLYDRSEYFSIKDVLNYGNEHFSMPPVDGMQNSMSTVQFNYARAIVLKSSQGTQIRINVGDTPMNGEFCTISLIIREDEE